MADVFVFGKGVNVTRLNREIISDPGIGPDPTSITARSGITVIDVTINFPTNLSAEEENALSGVVSGHIPILIDRPAPANVTTVNGLSGAITLSVSEDAIVTPLQVSDDSGTLNIKTGIPSASGALIDSQGTTITQLGATSGFFGSEYQEVSNSGLSLTTSSGFQQTLRLTTTSIPSGRYRVGWSFESGEHDTDELGGHIDLFRIQLNDGLILALFATEGDIHEEDEPEEGNSLAPSAGFCVTTLNSGVHTIDIDFRAGPSGILLEEDKDPEEIFPVAGIRRARLELWRVS